MNTEKFTGKVFVITGAGSGMGAAMAKEFAAREAKVALFDINDEGMKQIVDTICKNGGVAKAYHVDVTNKAEIENEKRYEKLYFYSRVAIICICRMPGSHGKGRGRFFVS